MGRCKLLDTAVWDREVNAGPECPEFQWLADVDFVGSHRSSHSRAPPGLGTPIRSLRCRYRACVILHYHAVESLCKPSKPSTVDRWLPPEPLDREAQQLNLRKGPCAAMAFMIKLDRSQSQIARRGARCRDLVVILGQGRKTGAMQRRSSNHYQASSFILKKLINLLLCCHAT